MNGTDLAPHSRAATTDTSPGVSILSVSEGSVARRFLPSDARAQRVSAGNKNSAKRFRSAEGAVL